MRPSRMMGVEETDANVFLDGGEDGVSGLGAPGYWSPGSPGVAFSPASQRQNQTFGGPGTSFPVPRERDLGYGDGVSAIEPVMTLASHQTPGRTARRRSMAGQLRREAEAFGQRTKSAQLAGWTDVVSSAGATVFNTGAKVGEKYIEAKTGGALDVEVSTQGVSVGAGPIVPGVIDGQTLFTTKEGEKVKLAPEQVAQVQKAQLDMKSIIMAALSQGKTAKSIRLLIPRKKKSKLVPIVAGVAAVGLIAWLL